jgi:hypothetical protein
MPAGAVSTPPLNRTPEQLVSLKPGLSASPLFRATAIDSAAPDSTAKAVAQNVEEDGHHQQQQQQGPGRGSSTKLELKLSVVEAVHELATVAVQDMETTRAVVKEGVRQRYNQVAGVVGSTGAGAGTTMQLWPPTTGSAGAPTTHSFWAAGAGSWGMPIEEEAASEASSDWLGSDVLLECEYG